MRKRVKGQKLSMSRTARDALVRSQIRSLVLSGKIVTTKAKAKLLQRSAERVFSMSLADSLAVRRRVLAMMANDRKTVDLIFESARNWKRKSGFTRLVLMHPRRGDASPMAQLEMLEEFAKPKPKEKKKKEAKKDVKAEEPKKGKTTKAKEKKAKKDKK